LKRLALVSLIMAGCAGHTLAPLPAPEQQLHGIASWYGEEFAGRTTANGEIFDPLLLTAAHRTLPFGTVVDVKNPKTNQSVRVRINDRGPYVGGRLIDLSYAAAKQIGLVEPGSGDVDMTIVHVGRGDLEPPAPYEVTVADPPKIEMPLPAAAAPPSPSPAAPSSAVVDRVQVIEERPAAPAPSVEEIPVIAAPSVETRRQVSPDGKTVEMVAITPTGQTVAVAPAPAVAEAKRTTAEMFDASSHPGNKTTLTVAPRPPGKFVVQVGAFGLQANAAALQRRLQELGQTSHIEGRDLFRVQIGPFETRELAIQARTRLESSGVSAIVLPAQ
jgi:rare lipoprotein A